MKPGHRPGCSCTSCVASDNPSVRQYIAGGSRIDKLYLGKYIPLREQKLLTKLIRTRAVYDDVRKELLSSSNVSVRGKADLRPKKRGNKVDVNDKNSSQAILEIVDLVDRGKASGPHIDLTECCSCCICQPDGPNARSGKKHKHHGHGHHEDAHAHHKTVRGSDNRKGANARHRREHTRGDAHVHHGSGHAMSKTSVIDKTRRAGKARASKQMRKKAKNVRSVPCTCTFDIKDTIQRKSKAMIRRMKRRPEKAISAKEYVYGDWYEEKTFETHGAYKAKALVKKSIEKLKDPKQLKRGLEAGAKASLRRLKESKYLDEENKWEMQVEADKSMEKIKAGARKSMEMLQTGAKIFAEKIKVGAKISAEEIKIGAKKPAEKFKTVKRKSVEKFKATNKVIKGKIGDIKRSMQSKPSSSVKKEVTKNLEGKSFRIKKDSVTKFREKLKLMEEMEDRERMAEEYENNVAGKRERNIGKSSSTSSVNIQTQEIRTGAKVAQTRQKKVKYRQETAKVGAGKKQVIQMKRTEQTEEIKTSAGVGTGKKGGTGIEKKQGTQMKSTEQTKETKTSTRADTRKKEGTQRQKSTDVAKKPQISINISTRKSKQQTKNIDARAVKKDETKRKRSVKSLTDIAQASEKTSKTASTDDVKENQIKRRKKHQNIADEETLSRTTVSDNSVNRQAVRKSSSFSSIEFYKDKPLKSSQTKLQQEPEDLNIRQKDSRTYVNKRHRGHHARKPGHRHRTSEPHTGTGGHALKRCFCTLKLKPKRTKVKLTKSATKGTTPLKLTKSATKGTTPPKNLKGLTRQSTETVQTEVSRHRHKALHLKPYECEPGVCVPGECDPYECDKLIKQRGVKHHSARTNTARQTKSASSFTKSISSVGSRGNQVHSPSKTKEVQRSSQIFHEKPLVHSSTPQRQAVRIGSTFSFNIEFFKDKPTNDNAPIIISNESKKQNLHHKRIEPKKRKQNKGVDGRERQLRNRHSQGSTSTLKSKYTATKHSLRRCFCTLKLKPGKGQVKPHLTSKVSLTSRSVITQTRKLRETKKKTQNERERSYECEPGICIPGECNPYECLKILNKRQGPHIRRHKKHSNTNNNKTRSAGSFTSRSGTLRAKRVHSSVTYQTHVPGRQYKENIIIKKMPREIKTSSSNPNRQAVRIGSTFSFDIEFFKDKQTPISYAPIKYVLPPVKSKDVNNRKINLRDTGSQGDISQDQSVPVQVERKQQNARIGAAMKRCFCTLKLYKDKKENFTKNENTKDKKGKKNNTTGTATPILKDANYPTMATKGTKTKKTKNRYAHNLKPYECEPYVCTPGECDPYECLERIKRRGHSKEFGTTTDQTKMRSESSLTQNSSISLGTGTDKTRFRGQDTSTKAYRTIKHGTQPTRVRKSTDSLSAGNSRQVVKLGSSFSFDIEFYKNRQPLVRRNFTTPIQKTQHKIVRNKTNTGANARQTPLSTQQSQVEGGKKKHKAAGIKSALKRCFCTLQLSKNNKQLHNTNMTTNVRPPKVYTVSRMTVAETKITKHRQEHEYEFEPYNLEYYGHRSKKVIEMQKRQIHLESSTKYNRILANSPTTTKIDSLLLLKYFKSSSSSSLQYMQIKSNFNINATFSKETNRCLSISNLSQEHYIKNKNNEPLIEQYERDYRMNKFSDEDASTLYTSEYQVTGASSFLSRCFCTMNIKTDVAGPKLKPYECEPGVCVPYECDPYQCQKRIIRRMRASKMSGTDAMSRSTFSYSNLTPSQRAKKLQSRMQKRSTKTTHASYPIAKYKGGPSKSQKQLVRVGSTFSFDIQFSKDRSLINRNEEPRPNYRSNTKSIKTVNRRTKGTNGKNFQRHSRDSQSGITTVNKGSSGSPMLKRCFCTLKLQKRDKQEKHVLQSISHSTMTAPNIKPEVPTAETTTTRQNTKPRKFRALDPNECEPYICVPGKCNPIECLELIKKRNRKTKGLGTASTASKSVSSLTDSKKIKGQRVQSDFRGRKNRGNAAKFRNTHKGSYTKSSRSLSPNKQVVRIGSNFSFNIEFYKDRMPQSGRQDTTKTFTPRQSTNINKRALKTSRISTSTAARRRGRESQAGTKLEHRASGAEPSLKRCFCTLKLQKQGKNPLQIEQVSVASQGTKTRTVKETPTLHTRSVMTKEKKLKLKPYECEPNICIPGECDPYECDKRIKKRLRKEFGTSTARHGKRSVSSMSTATNRAKKVRNAGMQHKYRDRPIPSKDANVQKAPMDRLPIKGNPQCGQSVRFGSSFSFDIEFFKDKSLNGSPIRGKRSECGIKESRRSKTQPLIAMKHKKNKTSKNVRHMDSQVLAKKVRSTVTEITPFLKRCFCTLKLNKKNNRMPKKERVLKDDEITLKSNKNNNKMIKPRKELVTRDNEIIKPTLVNESNSANIKEVKVILPPKANTKSSKTIFKSKTTKIKKHKTIRNLDPYECEPGVCVPGECNPYKCLERIKRREMQSRMSGTDRTRGRTISSHTSPSGKAKFTQSKFPGYKHQMTANNEKYVVEHKRFKSIENPIRQAVHISSNFSFNVEFYKDRTPEFAERSNAPVKDIAKKILRSDETESKKIKNKTHGSQPHGTKVKSRGAGMGSFLKRCFCTLKLQKMENDPSPNIPDKSVKTSTGKRHKSINETVSVGVGTKNKLYNLKPYECEPNICVPGECNPYECLKRIKRRNRSTTTLTSKYGKCKDTQCFKNPICKDTQCYKGPKSRCKNTQCNIRNKSMKESKYQTRHYPTSGYSNRQSVRMGSSFSFDCEFFKDRTPTFASSPKTVSYSNKRNNRRNHTSNQSQMVGVKTAHKGSSMGPMLKRCFCTLKLKKDSYATEAKTINYVSVDVKPQQVLMTQVEQCRNTKTSKICTPRNQYPSKPQNIPGQYCNKPLCQMNLDSKDMTILNRDEIYENVTKLKTKKNNGIKKNLCIATEIKRNKKAQRSVKMQGNSACKKKHSAHPRYSNANRQALRIGSSFSFDIEFFRDRSPGFASKLRPKEIKRTKRYTSKALHDINKISNQKSQANDVKKENKGFGPLLKRCFCTLKLQKSPKVNQKQQIKASNFVSFEVKPKVHTDNKKTSTKSKYVAKKILSLSPYECEPGACIPRKCDPYECLQKIKKRGRTIGTSTKKANVRCAAASCAPSSKCKRMQCGFNDKKNVQTEVSYIPKEPHVVEHPQFENPLRSGVKYGSNISCNIEFFKETLPPRNGRFDSNGPYYPKANTKNAGVCHERHTFKDIESQSDYVKTEDKGVARRLQRCFCTLKLQNSPPSRNIAPYPKVVEVRRISVKNDVNMSDLYCSTSRGTKLLHHPVTKRNKDSILSNTARHRVCFPYETYESRQTVFYKKRDSNVLKTIFPYIPSKFNKNNSKASVISSIAHSDKKHRSRRNCSNTKNFRMRNISSLYDKKVKRTMNEEATRNKKQLLRETESTHARNFGIKYVIECCTRIFRKSAKPTTNKTCTSKHIQHAPTFNKDRKDKRRKHVKIDAMCKETKSDRGPPHSNVISIPKKSKSLKMAKVTERNKRRNMNINNIDQVKKIYSEFQSGDAGQHYAMYRSKKPLPVAQKYNNKYLCSYCQVLYNKDKKNFNAQEKPLFMDEKVVQLTLISPNNKKQQKGKDIKAKDVCSDYGEKKRKSKKAKHVCEDCGEELCGTEVNVYCPCVNPKAGVKLKKKQSNENQSKEHQSNQKKSKQEQSNEQKSNLPKQGILKNCQGACKGICEICKSPQNLINSKKLTKGEEKIIESKKKGKSKKGKENKSPQEGDADSCLPCLKAKQEKKKTQKKISEKIIPEKKIPAPPLCVKPPKPPKPKKIVCKTKKPCACCDLAPSKTKSKSAAPATPALLSLRKMLPDNKCKSVCKTQSEEEAMMKVMRMFKNCQSKLLLLIPRKECNTKPMFQMRMDAHSMSILNREEINEKVTHMKKLKEGNRSSITPEDLKRLHGKGCKCCICKSYKPPPKPPKQPKITMAQKAAKLGRKLGFGKQPCICGSLPCQRALKKKEEAAANLKKLKDRRKHPCVCGSKICEAETIKQEIKHHAFSKKGRKKLKKDIKQKSKNKKRLALKKKNQAKAMRDYQERQKRYKIEDDLRRKRRKRDEKLMDAQVKKYRSTSVWLLAAESTLDVGRLGVKTATGLLRTVSRLILDPKHTVRLAADAKQDPRRILTNLKRAWSDSGISSTAKRVKVRFGAFACFQRLKECVESHACTNFLYHMFDKNPKARLQPRKKRLVRKREPVDFECSLFMATLRKKPFWQFYYKCQWFYPHLVGMLKILKSVGDVALFILAAVVWSPCLLCIECCRALMCCTLCTG